MKPKKLVTLLDRPKHGNKMIVTCGCGDTVEISLIKKNLGLRSRSCSICGHIYLVEVGSSTPEEEQ
jgi:hypothetical protein